jgi:hypothetical protein
MMELTRRKMATSSAIAEENGAKSLVADYVSAQRQPSEAFLASSKRAQSTQQNLAGGEEERVPGWLTVTSALVFFVVGLVSCQLLG